MVNYGDQSGSSKSAVRGLGDPMTVAGQSRPTTASLAKWAVDLTGRPDKVAQCHDILGELPAFAEIDRFDQRYFPTMVERVKAENAIEFGPGSDRPD